MKAQSAITTQALATALRAGVHGDVVTPDEPSFPASTFGMPADARPEVVVIVADADDVGAAVRTAARAGRTISVTGPARTSARGTGRAAASAIRPGTRSRGADVVVVTRLLASVVIDRAARTATAGIGASWRQVLHAAQPFGLGVLSDSGPDHVGRAGALPAGFAPGQVRSMQVVTRVGELMELDARTEPDRFVAVRSGQSAFGLITAVTVELVPIERLFRQEPWFATGAAARLVAQSSTRASRRPPLAVGSR